MKIVILCDNFGPDRGGAIGIAYAQAVFFSQNGYSVSVVGSTTKKEEEGKTSFSGITVYQIYSDYHPRWRAYRSLYNPQTVSRVKEIFQKEKPDVIHAHNIHYYLSYHCLKLARQSGARVFLTAHDVMLFHYAKFHEFIDPRDLYSNPQFDYRASVWQQIRRFKKYYNPFRNIMIRHYLRSVDKIFAVSQALKEALLANGIDNVVVVRNGITLSDWGVEESGVDSFKTKYSLQHKKIVLFAGRLGPFKGSREIVKAMKYLAQDLEEAVLLVAGSKNEYSTYMADSVKKFGLQNRVVAVGWLKGDSLKTAYKACDVVVVPSVCFDSFPTVNLEAMASRKPVVGTCFGGTSEAIVDGVTGFVVNPYATKEMAQKITYLLKNPKTAISMGQAGYDRVKEKFLISRQMDRIVNWYNKIP